MAPFAIIELMCGTASDNLYDHLFVQNNSRFYTMEGLVTDQQFYHCFNTHFYGWNHLCKC